MTAIRTATFLRAMLNMNAKAWPADLKASAERAINALKIMEEAGAKQSSAAQKKCRQDLAAFDGALARHVRGREHL